MGVAPALHGEHLSHDQSRNDLFCLFFGLVDRCGGMAKGMRFHVLSSGGVACCMW